MKPLQAADFIPFNIFETAYPVKTDLVYAQAEHADNHFRGLYHADAKYLWAHRQIVPTVLLAALICRRQFGWTLKLNDCFRPVEAQEKMASYGYDPELVSVPGAGAHPRGMAMDVQPIGENGALVDMGTPFDYFAADLGDNPAARDYTNFAGKSAAESQAICTRRKELTGSILTASKMFGQRILPLPQEWWDFRFEKGDSERQEGATYWGDYAPAREADLPPYMRLVAAPAPVPGDVRDEWQAYLRKTDMLVRSKAQALNL